MLQILLRILDHHCNACPMNEQPKTLEERVAELEFRFNYLFGGLLALGVVVVMGGLIALIGD